MARVSYCSLLFSLGTSSLTTNCIYLFSALAHTSPSSASTLVGRRKKKGNSLYIILLPPIWYVPVIRRQGASEPLTQTPTPIKRSPKRTHEFLTCRQICKQPDAVKRPRVPLESDAAAGAGEGVGVGAGAGAEAWACIFVGAGPTQ